MQLLLAACAAAAQQQQPDFVNFTAGAVMGTRTATLRSFFAVPFAASTGGANMFAPPQPRAPWDFVMDVSAWGAGCTQTHHNPDVPLNQSQDCLNVNIFAPVLAPGQQVPVMVFFNGGAFLEGSNQGPFGMYSGASLVQSQGIVLVAANYRLGAFGNLATGREGVSGNFGLMDQVAALQWVQANIGAVGGNASEVTVFGESAGAMSVGLLLATGLGRGLFSRAIMESNVAGFNYKNLSQAAVYADTFCGLLNCSACALACLRAAPPQAIAAAWNTATGDVGDWLLTNLAHVLDGFLGTGPTRDGAYVPSEPMAAVESGAYWGRSVPVLLGTNTNEGETFIYDGVDFPLPGFLAEAAILGIFEDLNVTERVQGQPRYHYQNFPDGRTPLSNVVTDYWFRCASEKFLAGAHAAGTAAWAYRFDRAWAASGARALPAIIFSLSLRMHAPPPHAPPPSHTLRTHSRAQTCTATRPSFQPLGFPRCARSSCATPASCPLCLRTCPTLPPLRPQRRRCPTPCRRPGGTLPRRATPMARARPRGPPGAPTRASRSCSMTALWQSPPRGCAAFGTAWAATLREQCRPGKTGPHGGTPMISLTAHLCTRST